VQDERAALGDEVGTEVRADQRRAQGRLKRKVESVDHPEVREAGPAGEALESGLLAVSDFLADEQGEEVTVGVTGR
jgi:hypothetical protein